ncbi:MAG: O-antigen ligase family protein [bacterium]
MKNNSPINPWRMAYIVGFSIILLLPILNIPPWFSPPDWGKVVVFRIVIAVLSLLFIYQVLFRKIKVNLVLNPRELSSWPFLLFGALFASWFLATIFSLDINFSLWGSPYRNGGFINLACCFAFAVLAFFTLKDRDWQKLINISIVSGILVSLVAICQQYGLLRSLFSYSPSQLPSTIGGPNFLSLYLLFTSLLAIVSAFKAERVWSKVYYWLSFILFLFVVYLSISMATYLAIGSGLAYFFLFYPNKKLLKIQRMAIILSVIAILGIIYLRVNPQSEINNNPVTRQIVNFKMDQSRLSAWSVSAMAIKNRPLFGYGPENFSIGFDRYYDPKLPLIQHDPYLRSSWWDRAHNVFIETAVTGGVITLAVYLSFFAVLFWILGKQKKYYDALIDNDSHSKAIVCHGIQTIFVAYFINTFFSFDTLPSQVMLFFVIAYGLFLIRPMDTVNIENKKQKQIAPRDKNYAVIFLLTFIAGWFIVQYNIRPFNINSRINIAKYYFNEGDCPKAIAIMETVINKPSIIDSYLTMKYVDLLKSCAQIIPDKEASFAKRGYDLLVKETTIWPTFTRVWILKTQFTNYLLEKETAPAERERLIAEAERATSIAQELSPKRQEIYPEMIQTAILKKDYQKAINEASRCIDLNNDYLECHWLLGISKILSGDTAGGEIILKEVKSKGYNDRTAESLGQLLKAYDETNNYEKMAEVYIGLAELYPKNAQFHIQLAFVYKELKEYEKAKQEALVVIQMAPELASQAEEFIKSLSD